MSDGLKEKHDKPTVKDKENLDPTVKSTVEPPLEPTMKPTVKSTVEPTMGSTMKPTMKSTVEPTMGSTVESPAYDYVHIDVLDGRVSTLSKKINKFMKGIRAVDPRPNINNSGDSHYEFWRVPKNSSLHAFCSKVFTSDSPGKVQIVKIQDNKHYIITYQSVFGN